MSEITTPGSNGHDDSVIENPSPKIDSGLQTDTAPLDIPSPKSITRDMIINSMVKGYSDNGTQELETECNNLIKDYLKQNSQQHKCCEEYNIIVLFDYGTLVKSDADRIYNAVTKFKEKKPILLIIYSGGGMAGSAYLIGKLCIDNADGKLVIVVPRMAKSAATLICCAANEIHMGSLSELGPIDPQINDLPALGLKYSVEHIAELVKRYPASSDMFAQYLNSSLPLINLGYYERVAESAIQYAEKLLSTHEDALAKAPNEIANELVYKYKDHSFVIDKSEAEEIFGKDVVKTNTPEYELGNELYMALSFINRIADLLSHNFYFTGSLNSDPVFIKRKSD